jgi:hypothetical protein
MMDLLFGLFGCLLVLTMLISAKMGKSAGIEEQTFNLVVAEVTADDPQLGGILGRMHIGFELTNALAAEQQACTFSPALPQATCDLGDGALSWVPVKYATTAGPAGIMATLFIGSPAEGEAASLIAHVRPVLRDVAALRDSLALRDDAKITVRLSLKSTEVFWEPAPFTLSVAELLELAEATPLSGALLLAGLTAGCTPDSPQAPCKVMEVRDGGLVFLPH